MNERAGTDRSHTPASDTVALRKDSSSCCVVEEIEMLRVLKAACMAGCLLPRWRRLCALPLSAFMLPSLSLSRGVSRIATSTMLRKIEVVLLQDVETVDGEHVYV